MRLLALLSALLCSACAQTTTPKPNSSGSGPATFRAPIEYTVVTRRRRDGRHGSVAHKNVGKWSDHRTRQQLAPAVHWHDWPRLSRHPSQARRIRLASSPIVWRRCYAPGRWTYTDLEPIGYQFRRADWLDRPRTVQDISVKQPADRRFRARSASLRFLAVMDYLMNGSKRIAERKFSASSERGPASPACRKRDIAQGFYPSSRPRRHRQVGLEWRPWAPEFSEDTPTINEGLGGNEYQWFVIRFAVVPKGTPEERKAYLGAAIRAAMKDPELVAEYLKAGVYFDPKLTDPSRMQANLNAYAEAERAFYVKTGRLK